MSTVRILMLCLVLDGCAASQDQEVQIGRQNAEQINQQLALVQDPAINDYIAALGKRMANRTSRSNLDWHFYVVNAAEVNSFALPGGFIYVNRGLIELTSNESQLAGAIGHEIGHVIERHGVKQMQHQQDANLGITAVCALTNLCKSTLAQAAIQVGGEAEFAHHSRHDEAQADSEAVVNTALAGIDPRGVPELFTKLLQERRQQPTVVDGWFADHPFEESRIRHANGLIQSLDQSQLQALESDSPEYHAMKARLAQVVAPPPARARPQEQDSTAPDAGAPAGTP